LTERSFIAGQPGTTFDTAIENDTERSGATRMS
jgi:hypothetical protein